jgi:glyoxylase-like metal-dependent hydrolase (beta-lactamase superfamily II)
MFNRLTKRVYYMDCVHEGDRPVLGVVIGDKYSLIIDGGNSKAHAEEFLSYIRKLNITELKYLVLTHWHWDHVFGIETMNLINVFNNKSNEKIEWMRNLSWNDEAIRERVKNGEEIEFCEENIKIEHPNNDRKINIPKADILYDREILIDLGNVTVKIERIDADHSNDCSLVTVVEEGVTFMGDAMYLDMYNGPYSYTKEKLYPLLEKLISYNSNFYIPAHHPKYTNSEFMDFVYSIKEIGDIVDDETNLEKAKKLLLNKRKKELTEDDIEDITAFVQGNKKKFNI